ncbi:MULTISPECIES: methylenetetrahydrofolate--tRNA-(uracil(54)-C(5))-methyltransferase (FADH(2)-oxidizing) TrmFO [unclassified Thomasclavelia]|uniref:methylenetetrahydrofolate--tRNA-(uracil(54)- C(5))-methyltransferase (FADH(2)-oxidizing) TrmFO n=1 Tax=unclassified Thomasclavelia TaxID=3025756 RepID=UPI000B36D967|nr:MULTISPECIES: methylenetetrahydrofolate--tRNA-(uracil(54)-C(5))-methyltransferase (FADH(2)-oxidizing) TrmFO [unclassified Thomasclavelia]OUP79085.1 methylenetetrahydrofolate--tRNA-(uracil(54)-C(5))-methyltransferase (FADH(2)-oxidizing) TrmFO [Erysipelatoclostridium sp. An173]
MEKVVNVIGAGLAGVEACHQLVKRGYQVRLYEMRPNQMTPAHHSGNFAELVCSNSLRADGLNNAVGVLKKEMEMLDSIVIKYAREHQVPAGGALAVDRENFSKAITEYISNHPLIEVIHEEVKSIPEGPTIIASGPLTSDALALAIKEKLGEEYFYFFDAAAPIITKESINFDIAYYKSRYDKGDNEYINCPMNEEQFNAFYDNLINAQVVKPKEFEEKFFEGCMPFEEMARRGKQTLLFGPMKPVGLNTPDGKRPYAVVQLRQDNVQASLYNIVGFQTHLTWPEQKRIIQMIPGLENAQFVRYGVMHRNSYICSPRHLLNTYQLKESMEVFMAGQITGVEGYVESAQSGMVAGINMARLLEGKNPLKFPQETVMGALVNYITNASEEDFQPMKANFGILPELETKVKKKQRKEAYANRAIATMEKFIDENGLG